MKLLISTAVLGLSFAVSAQKPNVILMMADDSSWSCYGCYGSEYKTPNIDKMAADGVMVEHCIATPLCSPSRVMIMTGKYNFRNYTHFGYLSPEEKTFGNLFKSAGYKTAIAGKWQLNGVHNELPEFEDPSRVNRAGFDEYCLWQLTKGKSAGERFWSPPIEQNGKFIPAKENVGKYGPDLYSDFLCDFMERNKEEPFFVYYPMTLVHAPFAPTPDIIGDAPKTQAANRKVKNRAANYAAMVNYTDKIVGKMIAKTEELGIAENTLILFTCDNGTSGVEMQCAGETIAGAKGQMIDGGTRVPLVAYWKGKLVSGLVLKDLVDFTDIYPTLADAAGIELGKDDPIDGRSFLPQMLGEKGNPRDWAFCHYQPYWNKEPGQFVRTVDYKLYHDGRFYKPNEDRTEKNDLSKNLKTEKEIAIYKQLKNVIETAPPFEKGKLGREATNRPVNPDWQKIGE